MNEISISQAFSAAPPRRPAVLCASEQGKGYIKAALWFTWLNMKHQPMLSFALERDAAVKLKAGDSLILAFPPVADMPLFEKPLMLDEAEGPLPCGVQLRQEGALWVPCQSETILRCTLANAYNYPFKNVRIHNCNLDQALGNYGEA